MQVWNGSDAEKIRADLNLRERFINSKIYSYKDCEAEDEGLKAKARWVIQRAQPPWYPISGHAQSHTQSRANLMVLNIVAHRGLTLEM